MVQPLDTSAKPEGLTNSWDLHGGRNRILQGVDSWELHGGRNQLLQGVL